MQNNQYDAIYLKGLKFYAYHGLFQEEKHLGQRFGADITLYLDLRPAGRSGYMNDSVHYGEVYEVIAGIMEGESVDLLETLAENVARAVIQKFDLVQAIQVRIIKPDPPIAGHYDSVAVEIYRRKEEY